MCRGVFLWLKVHVAEGSGKQDENEMTTAKSPSVSIPIRAPHAPIHTSIDVAALAVAGNGPVDATACPGKLWTWRRSAVLIPKMNRCLLGYRLPQAGSELLDETTLLGQLGRRPCPVVGGQSCVCTFSAQATALVGDLAIPL